MGWICRLRLSARGMGVSGRSARINNLLNGLVSGTAVDQVRAKLIDEIASDKVTHDELTAGALRLAQAAVPIDPEADVLVDGQSNLLAGKGDLERAKTLLRTLE